MRKSVDNVGAKAEARGRAAMCGGVKVDVKLADNFQRLACAGGADGVLCRRVESSEVDAEFARKISADDVTILVT